MSLKAEHRRLTDNALDNFNPEKAAKEYFEYEATDRDSTDMLIFMRDNCPSLYDKFMDEWGKAHEEMLSNWTFSQIPDGPED